MITLEDAELLRRYADDRSEAAFAELVRRHLRPVYAFALRQVGGDAHLAEDVTQMVFVALARKAASLVDRRVLGGWLCRTTHFAARDVVRAERRRRAREQEAHTMHDSAPDVAANIEWEKLHPVLTRSMSELNETDRDAVWLRFFEGRSFAEVGARLRLTENSARMRVERALDKLHAGLARRGVTSTAAALGVALASQAGAAAPAGLAASVTSAACAASASVGAWTAIFMSITKLHLATTGAVVLTGATVFALQFQTQSALHQKIAALRPQEAAVAALRAENRQLATLAAEVEQLRRDDLELQQLERTVAQLRKASGERSRAAQQQPAQNTRAKVEEYVQKLLSDERRAQEEIDRLQQEIAAMTGKLEVFKARANDGTLSPTERTWAQDSVDTLPAQIEAKKRERQTFIENVRRALTQRFGTLRSLAPGADAFIVLPPDFPTVGGAGFRDAGGAVRTWQKGREPNLILQPPGGTSPR